MSKPIVILTRTASVSAAHRLYSSVLSEEENQRIYGKCCHVHGHNYKIHISVQGPVNSGSGMVLNLADLNALIDKHVVDILDHKNLDTDIPFFKTNPSTTENLAVFVWHSLADHVNGLFEVRIDETDKNTVVFRGEFFE